jgi:phospholipid/cholesterol/gamma-HCH transport system substrate-binding protein
MSAADDLTGEPSRMELKVGLFVVTLIAIALGVVLLFGSQRRYFQPRVTLHAIFDDVGGLRDGAPVWLSGVSVGSVTRMAFIGGAKGAPIRVQVDVQIARRDLERVRSDSVARIGSQGLLGDKIVTISAGSPEAPAAQPGDVLETESPVDLDKLISQASDILEKGQAIAGDAQTAMHSIAAPETMRNFKAVIASTRQLLRAAERGPGLVHALFYDRRTSDDLREVARGLNRVTARVDDGVARLDEMLRATDDDGKHVINHLARAARNVGDAAAELRDSRVVPHLERASADLADLTGALKSGRGTLGALIVDPTVYEQLVTVLGGVQRSRILRALVRFAIRKDDGRSVGRAVDEPNSPATRPAEREPVRAQTPRVKQ